MRTIANWGYWLYAWVRNAVAWLFDRDRRTQSVVLLMSVVTVLLVAAQSVQNQSTAAQEHTASLHAQQVTSCQVRYNEALARITVIRARLNDEDRNAVKSLNEDTAQFIFGVAVPTPNLTQQQKVTRFENLIAIYRRAVSDYSRVETRIDQERGANPVPGLPPGACQ